MQDFLSLDKQALLAKKEALQQEYRRFQARGLNLNMARGKPGFDQTDLSVGLLDTVSSSTDYKAADGTDCRNYGVLEGLPELRALFGQVLGVDASQVFCGRQLQPCHDVRHHLLHDVPRRGRLRALVKAEWH